LTTNFSVLHHAVYLAPGFLALLVIDSGEAISQLRCIWARRSRNYSSNRFTTQLPSPVLSICLCRVELGLQLFLANRQLVVTGAGQLAGEALVRR
jgi:hypothetical protein